MSRLPHGEITLQEIAAAYPALALVADGSLRLPPVDPETAQWLDGPAFVKWLMSQPGITTHELNQALNKTDQRLVRQWQCGQTASVAMADRVLVGLGLLLAEVPDRLWTRPPNVGGNPITASQGLRDEIVARHRNGELISDLAIEFSVSIRSISKWVNGL